MGSAIDYAMRNQCKLAYCIEHRSVAELSERYGISSTTLYRWRKEDRWEEMCVARVMSGPMLAHKLKQQLAQIVDEADKEGRVPTSAETDKMYKLQLLIDKNDKKARFEAHCIDAMDLLNMYLGDRDPDLCQRLAPHVMPFLNHVLRHQAAGL